MRHPLLVLALLSAPVPALAITIADVPSLPQADRAAVNALEQQFFDGVASKGAKAAVVATFNAAGATGALTPELLDAFNTIDTACGKLQSVERYESVAFGSKVVRDHFVSAHPNCLIRWDLTYSRREAGWAFYKINFHTLQVDDWQRE